MTRCPAEQIDRHGKAVLHLSSKHCSYLSLDNHRVVGGNQTQAVDHPGKMSIDDDGGFPVDVTENTTCGFSSDARQFHQFFHGIGKILVQQSLCTGDDVLRLVAIIPGGEDNLLDLRCGCIRQGLLGGEYGKQIPYHCIDDPIGRLGRKDDAYQEPKRITLFEKLDFRRQQRIQSMCHFFYEYVALHMFGMVPLDVGKLKCVYSKNISGRSPVARAPALGAGYRRFESFRPDVFFSC